MLYTFTLHLRRKRSFQIFEFWEVVDSGTEIVITERSLDLAKSRALELMEKLGSGWDYQIEVSRIEEAGCLYPL